MMRPNDIVEGLNNLFPNPKCELNFNKDYELVISVMLSAQTTDKRVNIVTGELFKKYDSLDKLSKLTLKEVEKFISSIGLYKVKSKYFLEIVKILSNHDIVPNDREILESIPGIGRKSTNVILSVLYNEQFIAVDTHVSRVSKRLKIASNNDDVITTEKKLYSFFKGYNYKKIGQQLVLFGRYNCLSRKPLCNTCPFKDICVSKDKKIS